MTKPKELDMLNLTVTMDRGLQRLCGECLDKECTRSGMDLEVKSIGYLTGKCELCGKMVGVVPLGYPK